MGNQIVKYYAPLPVVEFYSSDNCDSTSADIVLSPTENKILQSYSFSTNINDLKGNFNISFYPDEKGIEIFDKIHSLWVVKIYETQQAHKDKCPDFVGIVKKKNYAAQMAENGVKRSVSLSGFNIAGLAEDFRFNFDTTCCILRNTLDANDKISKEFTVDLLTEPDDPKSIKDIVETIWKNFVELAEQYQGSTTPKVLELAKKALGEPPFTCVTDDKLIFPLGCIFSPSSGEQGAIDVIKTLLPQPLYEVLAIIEEGKPKIIIRNTPYDAEKWSELAENAKKIEPIDLINYNLTQSDDEIYTVFMSYVYGSAVNEQKYVRLQLLNQNEYKIEQDDEKFAIYGYRPLTVRFYGYCNGKSDDNKELEDTSTKDKVRDVNKKMKKWYSSLDKMYQGSITIHADRQAPQTGEVLKFLGGEFYITGTNHRWSYGGAPEIALSVIRGGKYDNGEFSELDKVTARFAAFEHGTTDEDNNVGNSESFADKIEDAANELKIKTEAKKEELKAAATEKINTAAEKLNAKLKWK